MHASVTGLPPPRGSHVRFDQLSERARLIFRDIIESFLANGAPIGSRTLSRQSGLHLSAASIRNVMQDLEELGLLAAPHTSAGRVPTEQGLRLFVDGMMQAATPSPSDTAAIEAEARRTGTSIEDTLSRTTAALSGLSQCAAVITTAKAEPVLKQLSFVPLSPGRVLVVLVGADGSVENRVLQAGDLPENILVQAQNYVNDRLGGLTLNQAVRQLRDEMHSGRGELDTLTSDLVARGLASWSTDGRGPVLIVRGQAHLLDTNDLERARALLEELEDKAELVNLLEQAREADAMKIFIGAENKLFALSGSSVIAAPYRGADGQVIGIVGVIGPTRLNYARVIPMVDFTANRLSRLMA